MQKPPKPSIKPQTVHLPRLQQAQPLECEPAPGTKPPKVHLRLQVEGAGVRQCLGQFTLLEEAELLGRSLVACTNLGARTFKTKERVYASEVLLLGTPNPAGDPAHKGEALPIYLDPAATFLLPPASEPPEQIDFGVFDSIDYRVARVCDVEPSNEGSAESVARLDLDLGPLGPAFATAPAGQADSLRGAMILVCTNIEQPPGEGPPRVELACTTDRKAPIFADRRAAPGDYLF